VVADAAAQVAFLRAVFDATGDLSDDRPAEMRIGDSVVMVSPAGARAIRLATCGRSRTCACSRTGDDASDHTRRRRLRASLV